VNLVDDPTTFESCGSTRHSNIATAEGVCLVVGGKVRLRQPIPIAGWRVYIKVSWRVIVAS
jgi:hypothetical protein